MDAKQAFKHGFLARCIEAGFNTPEKIAALLEKRGGITDTLASAAGWGLPALLAAPPIAGAVAGTALGRAQDIDDVDVEEAKKNELIAEYQRQAAHVARVGTLRRVQQSRAASGKVFL